MAFLVRMLGCRQDTTSHTVLCVLLMMSTLSFQFPLPKKGPVSCFGSNITSLCAVALFAICFTGWINTFWLPFRSLTVFVVVVVIVIIVDVAVWVRVIGVSVFVSRNILSFFSLFSLFLQQAALISVMSWFFTVVARWFVSVSISVFVM